MESNISDDHDVAFVVTFGTRKYRKRSKTWGSLPFQCQHLRHQTLVGCKMRPLPSVGCRCPIGDLDDDGKIRLVQGTRYSYRLGQLLSQLPTPPQGPFKRTQLIQWHTSHSTGSHPLGLLSQQSVPLNVTIDFERRPYVYIEKQRSHRVMVAMRPYHP